MLYPAAGAASVEGSLASPTLSFGAIFASSIVAMLRSVCNVVGLSKRGYNVETNAYIWARGEGTLDTTKTWDYEAFRKEYLGWYLDSAVKPCRKDFEKKQST